MIIAFDMDGTLLFLEDRHNLKVVEELSDTLSRVRFPSLESPVLAFKLFSKGSAAYMALSTHRLLSRLACCKSARIVIVSAARPSTVQKRFFALSAAHDFILENGGAIYEAAGFTKDPEWDELLKAECEKLPPFAEKLRSQGWNLDDEGRTAALRIRMEDNPEKTPEEFARLSNEIELPEGLAKTSNLGHLDIICASAGKDKALAHLSRKYREEVVYAVGDDDNDIPMLLHAKNSFVIGAEFPAVAVEAKKNGWQISPSTDAAGINHVLEQLIKNLG